MDQSNRIPAGQSGAFGTWQIPEVHQGQVIESERLQRRGPKGELVEIDKSEVLYQSFTAGQLEEITQQAYEDVREAAHQEGYQQGLERGYQEGLAKGQQQIQQTVGQLQQTLAALNHLLEGQDDQLEQALVNVASCIAKALIRRELTIDASHLAALVSEAVALLPLGSQSITVFLSQADFEHLKEGADIPAQWQLKVDSTLSAGGCRLETAQSTVDFTLEHQFQLAMNRLVEQRYTQLAAKVRGDTGSESSQ